MKVILLRDVAKIGRRFEIVNVPDGYALNKLIPAKDAEPASPANVKRVEAMKAKSTANKADLDLEIKTIIEKLASEPLLVPMDANEQGHLFKAVHKSDIVEAVGLRGFTLGEQYLVIDEQIKHIGSHQINIKTTTLNLVLPIEVTVKTK